MYARDPEGMEETRLRASTLLCKVFLQFVMRVEDGVEEVFLKVLDLLERFMAGSRKDSMVRVSLLCTFSPNDGRGWGADISTSLNVCVNHSTKLSQNPSKMSS